MLAGFGEPLGLPQEQAVALGRCLGGGMGAAQVCGAVTGALLLIGLLPADISQAEPRRRQTAQRTAARFRQEFGSLRGSILCRDLLGVDISTPEGRQQAVEQELFSRLCPELVGEAAKIVEALVQEHQAGGSIGDQK